MWLEEVPPDAAEGLLREAGFAAAGEPAAVLERLRQLRAAATLQRLDEPGRQRLDALVPAVLEIAARQQRPLLAVEGVARVIEAVGRRSAYFALLNENPAARERLVRLCAMSDFLAKQVAAHPLLLDELLDQRLFGEPPTRDELAAGARAAPGGRGNRGPRALARGAAQLPAGGPVPHRGGGSVRRAAADESERPPDRDRRAGAAGRASTMHRASSPRGTVSRAAW